MNRRNFIERLGRAVQLPISRIRWLARLYLGALGLLVKPLPDGTWKKRLLNGLKWCDWSGVELPASRVSLCEGISVRLIPHPGEGDLAAILFRTLPYEVGVFRWLAGREYDTVIEIGANVGIFTLFFSACYPAARVYSFEPSPLAYRRLLGNLAANGSNRVALFNCAVSDETGFADFFEPSGHLQNGSLNLSFANLFSSSVATRKVLAIDALGLEPLFAGRTLVKVDAEGADPKILASMKPLLHRFRPDLLVEVLPGTEDELNQLDLMAGGNYTAYSLTDAGAVPKVRLVANRSHRDYGLVPRVESVTT
jgi:FkbM family methyltransferase